VTETHAYDVLSTETVFTGKVVQMRKDDVAMPGGGSSQRDVVVHPGAVGVVAMDDQGRVLLIEQYRHPVRRRLHELPAGLLDVEHEKALAAGARELAEEAGLGADTWHVLVDALTSPGMTDEAIRLYLARDVRVVDRDVQEHEELEITTAWVPLQDAVTRVLAGEVENAMACLGVLAVAEAQRRDFAGLRPADAPWRSRPAAGG